jgi:molybdate transport system substrate-binding protein
LSEHIEVGMKAALPILTLAIGLGLLSPAVAAELSVAVAANFTAPAEEIAAAFTAATGHEVALSFGASGTLYAQMTQGAPFEVFLSADDRLPQRAEAEGFGAERTVFTYAIGALVLYGPSLDAADGAATLAAGDFHHIAIADPSTAPYGAAAIQTIAALGLTEAIEPKKVIGENVTQTLQFVESGNAELGFVALSQVTGKPRAEVWQVPGDLHDPIRQDAVLLRTGEADPVARQFVDYLKGPEGRAVIEKYGYAVADD